MKVKILIFYTTSVENRVLYPFNVSKNQYIALGTGRIRFDVIDISRPGGFSLKIKYNEDTKMSEYATAEEKSYSFDFGKTNVGNGTNILVIESLDNSVFHIQDLEVTLPRV